MKDRAHHQESGHRIAATPPVYVNSRTVLSGKGSQSRAEIMARPCRLRSVLRAIAYNDGRLRRESDAAPVFCLL